ncbi:hypothetical protein ES703_65369 [subsurface metagenome]
MQDDLEEVQERRRHRQRVEGLELRERERELARGFDDKPLPLDPLLAFLEREGGKGSAEFKELQAEMVRLRESVAEEKLSQVKGDVARLAEALSHRQNGKSELDLMSEALNKFESFGIHITDKFDAFMRGNKEEKALMRALSFGISPDEYKRLLDGQEIVITREDFNLRRHYQAVRAKEPFIEPTDLEYQAYVKDVEARNRTYTAISERVTKKAGVKPVKVEEQEPERAKTFECPECHSQVPAPPLGDKTHWYCPVHYCTLSSGDGLTMERVESILRGEAVR